jgi:hypothetical protein
MGLLEDNGRQGVAALPPALSGFKRISKLTDAAQELFSTLYDLERSQKTAVKVRLAAELDKLDLFGLTANRTDNEAREYQPDKRDWYT